MSPCCDYGNVASRLLATWASVLTYHVQTLEPLSKREASRYAIIYTGSYDCVRAVRQKLTQTSCCGELLAVVAHTGGRSVAAEMLERD
jgi:hypothetical protein